MPSRQAGRGAAGRLGGLCVATANAAVGSRQ
eukprot:COSAG06_NODE_62491_length_265_cov_0.548193_1_plen_30_part_10